MVKTNLGVTRFSILNAFVLLLLIACGGGGGDDGNGGNIPGISNLQYSPKSASLNEGGGAVTVTGTIDFVDLDGDVVSLTISGSSTTTVLPVSNLGGITAGSIAIVAVVETTSAGDFPFSISITDSKGSVSNTLIGSFIVN